MGGIIVRSRPVSSVSEAVADFLRPGVRGSGERITARARRATAAAADLAQPIAAVHRRQRVEADVAGGALAVVAGVAVLAARVLRAAGRRRTEAIRIVVRARVAVHAG